MMYKESYGNPSTDALYLGRWLTGYCDNWGDTWYMMNYSEDKDVRQSATAETKIGNLTVDMAPHTYAVTVSRSDSMVELYMEPQKSGKLADRFTFLT